MRDYDKRRKLKRELSQHKIIPKREMKMPEKNIPVKISDRLTVYISDPSKIEATKLKYNGR